jgi:DNA-binding transcriptional ArsR family regulator
MASQAALLNLEPDARFQFDRDRYNDVWRLAVYVTTNHMLSIHLRSMEIFRLRPAELLVFQIVAAANIQRPVRAEGHLGRDTTDIVPGDETNGTISRRRIAETTGLPRETVRRLLERLKARGLVVERGRGKMQVPVGIIMQGEYSCDPMEMFGPVLAMFDQLTALGVLKSADERGITYARR